MSNKFQNEDFKTEADLVAKGGTKAQLLNTTKLYSPKSADILETLLRKNNDAANVAPTTANDSTQGYEPGSRWTDTVTQKTYHCISNAVGAAVWKEGGGQGGFSDLDTLHSQNFDNASLSEFTHVGLTLDSVSPINGSKSAKLVHDPALNQYFKETKSVPLKFRGSIMTVAVVAKSNATSGNVTILFRDETNNVDLQTSQQINADATSKTFQYGVKIPSNCLSFSYTITALPQSGAPETYIDDVVIRNYWMGTAVQGQTEYQFEVPDVVSFSAVLEFNDPGTVSVISQSHPFIQAVSIPSDRRWYIDFVPGTFTVLPSVQANFMDNTGTQVDIVIATLTTSRLELLSNISDASIDRIHVTVSRQGADVKNIVKKVVSTDLVPAKAMSGNASIEVPKVSTQTSYLSQTLSVAAGTIVTGAAIIEGSGLYSYDSSSGIYTVLKKSLFEINASLSSGGAWVITSTIFVGSEAAANGSSAAVTSSWGSASYSGELDVGETFSIRNGAGGSSSSDRQRISISATEYITETKTWSATQSALIQSADASYRVNTFTYRTASSWTNNVYINDGTLAENTGSHIQKVASSTLGDYWEVLEDGYYSVAYGAEMGATAGYLYLNKSETMLNGTNDSVRLASSYEPGSAAMGNLAWSGPAKKGEKFWISRNSGDASFTANSFNHLVISKAGSLKLVETVADQKIKIPTSHIRFEGATSRGTTATSTIKFDSVAKLKGDAFEYVSTTVDGTYVKMKKAGKVDVHTVVYFNGTGISGYIYLNDSIKSRNYATGTSDSHMIPMSWSGDVEINDIIKVVGSADPQIAAGAALDIYFQEQEIAVSITNILPQFSEGDVVVRGSGNAGQTITTDVTDIPFTTIEDSTGGSWDGDSFVVPEDGIYTITGHTLYTTTTTRWMDLWISGARYKRISESASNSNHHFAITDRFVKGQVLSIRDGGPGGTLNNNGIYHNITITKVGKPNVTGVDVTPFIKIPQPTAQTIKLKSGSGTAGADITNFVVDRDTGEKIATYSAGRITFLKKAKIELTFKARSNAAGDMYPLIKKNGVSFAQDNFSYPAAANYTVVNTLSDSAEVGDYYTFQITNTSSQLCEVFLSATSTENVAIEENRPAYTALGKTAVQSIPHNTQTKMSFTSSDVIVDRTGLYDATNNRIVIKEDGIYDVAFNAYYNSNSQTGWGRSSIYKNGVDYIPSIVLVHDSHGSAGFSMCSTTTMELVKGDILELYTAQVNSGSVATDLGNRNFSVTKRHNSALNVANLKTIACRAVQSSGQSIANSTLTKVTFDAAKTFDTHNTINTTTGEFTCPESGYYQINAMASLNTTAATATFWLYLYKNGANFAVHTVTIPNVANNYAAGLSDVVQLNKGDIIDMRVQHNTGSAKSLSANAAYNYLSIAKL